MSIPTIKMASGRRTSGMTAPRMQLNLGIRSAPFPIPINTSARQKISENSSQNSPKVPQPCSSGAVTIKAVRFAAPTIQPPPTGNLNVCQVNNTAETPKSGHSSEQRKSLSTVTDISEIPSSPSKNQDASLLQNSTEPGLTLRKVKNFSEGVDPAARMNASISCQGIRHRPISQDSANKRKRKSEFIIKKISMDKCSRPVIKSNKALALALAKKNTKLLMETSETTVTNNKHVKKATHKKKVETVTREEIVKSEDIKEKVETLNEQEQQENVSEMLGESEDIKEKVVELNEQGHEQNVSEMHVGTEDIEENVEKLNDQEQEENVSEMLVDTEEIEIIYENVPNHVQAIVVRKEDIESNPGDHGKVEETYLEKKEDEIRYEVEVLQKLVDDKKKELQTIINVQAYCSLPPAEAYKENEQFYENIFPKKWGRLMRPLLHLVSPKVCKICIKEFGSIEEARAHFYTKSHVQNHLEQIEKESVCKDFLPPLWRRELHMEPETIEDLPCDAKFPW